MRPSALYLLLLLGPTLTLAEPRVPQDREEVLEILPEQRIAAPTRDSTATGSRTSTLEDTLALLQLAQREGDPRYLGQAEARLRQLPLTMETRLLRARLRQADHRFGEALVDLHQILQASPHHTEALLLQAAIHQVRGDLALARESCARITAIDMLMLALACRAQAEGLSGNGEHALQQLQKLTTLGHQLTDDQRLWLHLALGDLAIRLGQSDLAGAAYGRVMNQSPEAMAAYADWLLAQSRPATVVRLLREKTRHDGLLLRLALAEKQLGLPSAAARQRELQSRFAALALRGRHIHLREEALLHLKLMSNPEQALTLARQNWEQQREPADLLIYREAAQATNSQKDLRLIAHWMQRSKLQDVRHSRWSRS